MWAENKSMNVSRRVHQLPYANDRDGIFYYGNILLSYILLNYIFMTKLYCIILEYFMLLYHYCLFSVVIIILFHF